MTVDQMAIKNNAAPPAEPMVIRGSAGGFALPEQSERNRNQYILLILFILSEKQACKIQLHFKIKCPDTGIGIICLQSPDAPPDSGLFFIFHIHSHDNKPSSRNQDRRAQG
jgi:hypothetical protein